MVSLPKGGIAGKENSFLDQQLSQKERKAEVKILATGQKTHDFHGNTFLPRLNRSKEANRNYTIIIKDRNFCEQRFTRKKPVGVALTCRLTL